jgi:peptide deformylase
MALREIKIWPDPVLQQSAAQVAIVDEGVRALVGDLFDTMYHANGVGLAANQIGVPRRVLVIDLDPRNERRDDPELASDLKASGFHGPQAFINPEIIAAEGEILWEEGCLSVPGVNETVRRRAQVTVRAQDVDGRVFEQQATGLYAVAIQHETDHLDGRVFVEYLSRLKQDVIRRRMIRLKAGDESPALEAAD